MLRLVHEWDQAAMRALLRWRPRWATSVLRLFTYSGTFYAWVALALFLFVLARTVGIPFLPEPLLFLRMLLAPLAAWLTSSVVKRCTMRRRPGLAIDGFPVLTRIPPDSSFPSGHAAAAWSFCAALAVVHHPWAWLVGAWAFVVSVSRVYLGVHYPSDVLVGTGWGVAWGLGLAPWLQ